MAPHMENKRQVFPFQGFFKLFYLQFQVNCEYVAQSYGMHN